MSLLALLLLVVVICVIIGGAGPRAGLGYYGWTPLGVVLLVILILALTGQLALP